MDRIYFPIVISSLLEQALSGKTAEAQSHIFSPMRMVTQMKLPSACGPFPYMLLSGFAMWSTVRFMVWKPPYIRGLPFTHQIVMPFHAHTRGRKPHWEPSQGPPLSDALTLVVCLALAAGTNAITAREQRHSILYQRRGKGQQYWACLCILSTLI